MRSLHLWAFIFIWLAVPVWADTISCGQSDIQVRADHPADAELTCDAVRRAEVLFAHCNMPPFKHPLRVEIVRDLKPRCVAIYHCGESWIEVLEPRLMEERRSAEGAFGFQSTSDYFQSVLVHELAHATFDNVPCPFEACIVANEYVAYALQVMSLTPEAQALFARNSGLDRRVSRDELNAVILFMAPGRFAQLAWAHVLQRGDACGFIGQIMDGTVLLDRERF